MTTHYSKGYNTAKFKSHLHDITKEIVFIIFLG